MKTDDRKPTIYTIADLSGSSPSTVSAALNGTWKARRIKESTATRIQQIARAQGFQINQQARGLRRARSGLVGMILPVHDNRFFSSLSQSFEFHSRARGLCPVIASTLRDPEEELRTVETLISYAVDSLFVAGATNPQAISELCQAARLRHVYVDLPGTQAPSVVSDNFAGAVALTRKITAAMPADRAPPRNRPYFIGGIATDSATSRRIDGFCSVIGPDCGPDQIITCGYAPDSALREIEALTARIGGLPSALFINSTTAFEGVLRHFVRLAPRDFGQSVIGCFDYDPFASFLQFPVYMIRQNSDQLIATAFELIEQKRSDPVLIEIAPDLIPPRTIYEGPFSRLG